jgi:hypothetical protein
MGMPAPRLAEICREKAPRAYPFRVPFPAHGCRLLPTPARLGDHVRFPFPEPKPWEAEGPGRKAPASKSSALPLRCP